MLDSLQDEDEADIAADVGFVVALSVMAELFDVGVEGAELFLEQPTKLLRYLEVGRTLEDFEITVQSSATMVMFTAGGMATGAVIANSTLALLTNPSGFRC